MNLSKENIKNIGKKLCLGIIIAAVLLLLLLILTQSLEILEYIGNNEFDNPVLKFVFLINGMFLLLWGINFFLPTKAKAIIWIIAACVLYGTSSQLPQIHQTEIYTLCADINCDGSQHWKEISGLKTKS